MNFGVANQGLDDTDAIATNNAKESFCLYVDDQTGEVIWWTTMVHENVANANARRKFPEKKFKTGILASKTGWHFFAVVWKSVDTHHDEMARTDF